MQPIIMRLIRRRGITQIEMARFMGISRPTLSKYIRDPLTMDGINRKWFAKAIGVSIESLDAIINGKAINSESINQIIETIKPKHHAKGIRGLRKKID